MAGLAASIFLHALKLVTDIRIQMPELVYGLPFAGILIGFAYHRYGKEIMPGTDLIIDQIHEPKKTIPFRMAPLILFSTLLTHLFGGSAGREGTVVQISASLSDQLSRFFNLGSAARRALLISGTGAGFGAALGAPWAGFFFGMEILRVKRFKIIALVECLIAAWIAYSITNLLHAPHTGFPKILDFSMNWNTVLWTGALSISLAMLCFIFISLTHWIERVQNRFVKTPYIRPFVGGLTLVFIFKFFSLENFEGLGLDTILKSFESPLPALTSLIKLGVTAITLGSGFKGGEFIPLVFIGATTGNLLSQFSHSLPILLPALGCVALFGAASKTPLSCSVLAIELFGWKIAPLAFLTCYLSFFLSGKKGIYRKVHS